MNRSLDVTDVSSLSIGTEYALHFNNHFISKHLCPLIFTPFPIFNNRARNGKVPGLINIKKVPLRIGPCAPESFFRGAKILYGEFCEVVSELRQLYFNVLPRFYFNCIGNPVPDKKRCFVNAGLYGNGKAASLLFSIDGNSANQQQ